MFISTGLASACQPALKPLFGKSGSGLPKTKVRTRCVRIGSYRLYAPWSPLPRTRASVGKTLKETSLQSTRLDLHSLRCGSFHRNPSHPVGAGVLARPAFPHSKFAPLHYRLPAYPGTRTTHPPPSQADLPHTPPGSQTLVHPCHSWSLNRTPSPPHRLLLGLEQTL